MESRNIVGVISEHKKWAKILYEESSNKVIIVDNNGCQLLFGNGDIVHFCTNYEELVTEIENLKVFPEKHKIETSGEEIDLNDFYFIFKED